MGAPWINLTRTDTVFEQKVAATVFADFTVTGLDPLFTAVRGILPADAYIAGGYLTCLLAKIPVNDIDIWFKTSDAFTATKVAVRALLTGYSGATFTEVTRGDFTGFLVSRAGLQDLPISVNGYNLFTSPAHVIDTFDFTAVQLALEGPDLWVGPTTLADITEKNLNLHRTQNALRERAPKYLARGFKITSGMLTKIGHTPDYLGQQLLVKEQRLRLSPATPADAPIITAPPEQLGQRPSVVSTTVAPVIPTRPT